MHTLLTVACVCTIVCAVQVSVEEYIIFNLKQMGKVDEDTVQLLREQFKALDADASGELDADDLELLRRACDQMSSPVR